VIRRPGDWAQVIVAVTAIFALFHVTADALRSYRGEFGVLIGLTVVSATIAADRLCFGASPRDSVRRLGFRAPAPRGVLAVALAAGMLILVLPVFSAVTRTPLRTLEGWPVWIPGLFAQAGIAEETLFRGFLFARLREGRSFGRAASLAMIPFVVAHLFLFFTMPVPIAAASVLLAVVVSFPLARLFELGGGTIWAPAILHLVIQGAIKVIEIPASAPALPLVWMAASALVPFVVFVVPRDARREVVAPERAE
jgi:membrane protease YdiL (CAAX protease family)